MADIPLEHLLENVDNVYEAVVAMCKRARQVTDEQKQLIEMEMESVPIVDNRENEDFDDVEIDREALMREYKKYPKPSRVVIEEMSKGEIEYRFIDNSDEIGDAEEEAGEKESKETGSSKDATALKGTKANKEVKASKKDAKVSKDAKAPKDTKATKGSKTSKEAKES